METFITLQPKNTKTSIIVNVAHIVVAYASPGGTTLMLTNGGTIQTRYPIPALERRLEGAANVCSFIREKDTGKNKERNK